MRPPEGVFRAKLEKIKMFIDHKSVSRGLNIGVIREFPLGRVLLCDGLVVDANCHLMAAQVELGRRAVAGRVGLEG